MCGSSLLLSIPSGEIYCMAGASASTVQATTETKRGRSASRPGAAEEEIGMERDALPPPLSHTKSVLRLRKQRCSHGNRAEKEGRGKRRRCQVDKLPQSALIFLALPLCAKKCKTFLLQSG